MFSEVYLRNPVSILFVYCARQFTIHIARLDRNREIIHLLMYASLSVRILKIAEQL